MCANILWLDGESSIIPNILQNNDRLKSADNTFVQDKEGLESLLTDETDFLIANLACLDEGGTPIDDMMRYIRMELGYNGHIIALEQNKNAFERIDAYLFDVYNVPVIAYENIFRSIGGGEPDHASTIVMDHEIILRILKDIEDQMYRLSNYKQPEMSQNFQPDLTRSNEKDWGEQTFYPQNMFRGKEDEPKNTDFDALLDDGDVVFSNLPNHPAELNRSTDYVDPFPEVYDLTADIFTNGEVPGEARTESYGAEPVNGRHVRLDNNSPAAGPLKGIDSGSITVWHDPRDYEYELVAGIGDGHGHPIAYRRIFERLQANYEFFKDFEKLILQESNKLVFTGDYIDRGAEGLAIIEMLMYMQRVNNGNVVTLFGNHELLALSGLNRARNASETGNYDDYYSCVHGFNGGMKFIEEFGMTKKSAFKTYVKRMSREGDVGIWMRNLQPLHYGIIYDKRLLFVHGGVPPNIKDSTQLDEYVEEFNDHIETPSEGMGQTYKYLGNDNMTGRDSIFWDRSLPRMNSAEEVAELKARLGVDFIVIGHTPQQYGIGNIHNTIFEIDVGMCPEYAKVPGIDNDPAAIVFKINGVFACYAQKGEQELLHW